MVASGDRGIVIDGPDGPVVFFPCAGEPAPVNPCDPDAEMLLTVTGASGTVNWCGETWNLPTDSGVQKSVCPTSYGKGQYTQGTSPYTYWIANHIWNYFGSSGLILYRNAETRKAGGSYVRTAGNYFVISLRVVGALDKGIAQALTPQSTRPVAATTAFLGYSTIGLLTSGDGAEWTDYQLTNNFFGSYTTGGITYAWAKGQGW